jgi:FkbM family methyltransferase
LTTLVRSYRTPKGGWVKMAMRLETADEPVISSTSQHDEYGVAGFDLKPGELMLDVGAYIGSVGLAVAADYPETRVVMVEVVPENVAVIRESIAANGWDGRVTVHHAAAACEAGESTIRYGVKGRASQFRRYNRYVGGLLALGSDGPLTATVQNLSLTDLTDTYGDVAWLKIDCEGCEYSFLRDPAIWRVDNIIGEYHRGEGGITDLLAATHLLAFRAENGHVGIFEASRR